MSSPIFRGSPLPTLGVELEFQLVDAQSLALTGAAEQILGEIPGEFRGSVKPEFYHCCVEISTDVCRDVTHVEHDLKRKLAATAQVAGRHGVLLGWGGTHPFSHWREQPVVSTPRYRALAEEYRETLCRQLTFGLHIHVGVPDGDTAVRVCGGLVEHLPTLAALSANSPFWCGRATGLHSQRLEVMGVSPTGAIPPRLSGWDEYAALLDRLTVAGVIGSAKDLWWDVRPSAQYGTVEVRICDMPLDLPSVLALTTLVQCLVTDLAQNTCPFPVLDDGELIIVRHNRWWASRYGLGATFVDPRSRRPVDARGAVKSLTQRLTGVASALGCARSLNQVCALAERPSGAEEQLAVFARTGELRDVVQRQVAGVTRAAQRVPNGTWHALEGLNAVSHGWSVPLRMPSDRAAFAPD